jgi:ketosteroid isomerase-like protein
LFAEDGAVYWEDRPPTSGPEAIEDFMGRQFAENPGGEGGFSPDRVDVAASGDLAVEQGTYNTPNEAGRYITVYRKIGSDWKVAADMSLSTSPDGGAPAWARESLARWYETFNARDVQGLADLYTADARVGDARGRAALIQRFRAGWAESDDSCSGGYDDFVVVGSIAAGWGRDVCMVTPADGGSPTTVYSNWLAVYERQADGSWLCIRDYGEPLGS